MVTPASRHGIIGRKEKRLRRQGPRFFGMAMQIGRKLVDAAIWHENRCIWTGDDARLVNGEWKVIHGTVDAYFYSGTAGIARFLLSCWEACGEESLRATAAGAIRQSLWMVGQGRETERPLGLYDGMTGVALVATDAGIRLGEPGLLEKGRRLTEMICDRIGSGRMPGGADLISGKAGVLLGLLRLAKITGDRSLHEVCRLLSKELLEQAERSSCGWYWPELGDGGNGLCGLGHGASGVAHALLEYGTLANDGDCLAAAWHAMRYERSWFHRDRSNWPDLRHAEDEDGVRAGRELVYPVYWCHGAAGIGLTRLRAYQLTKKRGVLAEAGAAIQAVTRELTWILGRVRRTGRLPMNVNFSICHGMGSIVELFVCAHRVLGRAELLDRARAVGDIGIRAGIRRDGSWRCGIQGGREAPGLMLGLAGIGSSFLQLHRPFGFGTTLDFGCDGIR